VRFDPLRRTVRDHRLISVAVLAVGVFLAWSALELRDMVATLYLNGDNASALTLAHFAGDRHGGLLVLGNYRWLEPLFGMHLTKGLPYHRQLWEAAPFAFYGVTVLLAGWTAWRALGRREGLLVVLAMAAPSPIIFGFLMVPNAHAHTLVHTVLLAALLVVAPGLAARGTAVRATWAAAVAVSLAPAVASDVLIVAGATAGFAAALVVGWRTGVVPRAVAAFGVAGCVAGVVAGHLLVGWADGAGIRSTGKPYLLASTDLIGPHARMLVEALGLYGHGRFGGDLAALNLVKEALGLAVAGAVVFGLWRSVTPQRAAALDPSRPVAARLLVVFSAVVVAGTAAAYILTTAPEDIYSARYTLPMWPALLYLVLILVPRFAWRALPVLAAVCAVMGCIALHDGDYTDPTSPFPRADLAGLVASEHLDHGYAGYYDAATLTAQSDFRARVYPLRTCGAGGVGRCPYILHRIDWWYTPKPSPVRTFYVQDAATLPDGTGSPLASWGTPAKVVPMGQLTVYVYDHDIAAQLGEGG
jgi:hypothetical protein